MLSHKVFAVVFSFCFIAIAVGKPFASETPQSHYELLTKAKSERGLCNSNLFRFIINPLANFLKTILPLDTVNWIIDFLLECNDSGDTDTDQPSDDGDGENTPDDNDDNGNDGENGNDENEDGSQTDQDGDDGHDDGDQFTPEEGVKYGVDDNGNIINEDGKIVLEGTYHEDENGNIVDENNTVIVPAPPKEESEEFVPEEGVEYTINEDADIVDQDGNVVKVGDYKLDNAGNIVDANNTIIIPAPSKDESQEFTPEKDVEYTVNEDADIVDEDGNVVLEGTYHVDENGNIVDEKNSIIIPKESKEEETDQFIPEEGVTYTVDDNGNVVDQEGNVILEGKYHTDDNGNILDDEDTVIIPAPQKGGSEEFTPEEGITYSVNDDADIVDQDGNVVQVGNFTLDDSGNIVDANNTVIVPAPSKDESHEFTPVEGVQYTVNEDADIVDQDGNVVLEGTYHVDENGNIVDENDSIIIPKEPKEEETDGDTDQFTPEEGVTYTVDDAGNVVDQEGNGILEGKYHMDDSGNILDDENTVIIPVPQKDESEEFTPEEGITYSVNDDADIVDQDGNVVQVGNFTLDDSGNIVDANNTVIIPAPSKDESHKFTPVEGVQYTVNDDADIVDQDGNVIMEGTYHVDKDGNILDENDAIIIPATPNDEEHSNGGSDEFIPEEGVTYTVDNNGNIVDQDGKVIKEGNYHIDESGIIVDQDGNSFMPETSEETTSPEYTVNDEGDIVDKDGNVIKAGDYKLDEAGNIVDTNNTIIVPATPNDEDHSNGESDEFTPEEGVTYGVNVDDDIVDQDGNVVKEGNYKIDDAGNIVNQNGTIIVPAKPDDIDIPFEKEYSVDKNGNVVDEDGKVVEEGTFHIDDNGNIVDEEGNLFIPKDPEGARAPEYTVNDKGDIVDQDGKVVKKGSYEVDDEGYIINKDGERVDEQGKPIDPGSLNSSSSADSSDISSSDEEGMND